MAFASEEDLEQWALGELQGLGFTYLHGAALSPEASNPVRESFQDVLIISRLEAAVRQFNPGLPDDAVRTAVNAIRDTTFSGDLISENRRLHAIMVGGVPVSWFEGGQERHDIARLVDWSNTEND